MGKIIAFTNITLDGVIQAPASPDEDTRDGFTRGGWAAPYAAMQDAGDVLGNVGAALFGRWTYESFYAAWANRTDNPFSAFFDNIQKYVVSTTLAEPLIWQNSTLIKEDIAQAVGRLKQAQERDIVVFGSGALLQSLMRDGLVDRFVLLIHPLVLGSGRRLFADDGTSAGLQLASSKTTSTGVIIATYQPADPS
ncbi:MAG TPA: dihydrofolate reductase family protein [Herpetosiphonaceae bacterium]